MITTLILLIEDNKADEELLKRVLSKQLKSFEIECVDNETDYISALQQKQYDIIISDYLLPTYNGMSALKYRNTNFPLLPFIIEPAHLTKPLPWNA